MGDHLAVLSYRPHQDAGDRGHLGGGRQREGGDGGGCEVTDGLTATVNHGALRQDLDVVGGRRRQGGIWEAKERKEGIRYSRERKSEGQD